MPALVAAEGEKRHHNEHRGDAGGDEQQRLIFEGAAGQDGLNRGLAHDAQATPRKNTGNPKRITNARD